MTIEFFQHERAIGQGANRIDAPRTAVQQLPKFDVRMLQNRRFREFLHRHPRLRERGATNTLPADSCHEFP